MLMFKKLGYCKKKTTLFEIKYFTKTFARKKNCISDTIINLKKKKLM